MTTVKTGDTHPVQWRANMDLTGSTVRLVAKPRRGNPIVLACTVTDATDGLVTHTLTGTLAEGSYSVELEVTAGSEVVTFPNDGYTTLTVIADLD